MDLTQIRKGIGGAWGKYKYILLIILLGMVLLWLPESGDKEPAAQPQIAEEIRDAAEELEEILAQMDGVGKVNVMLSQARGEEVLYQTDEDQTVSADTDSLRRDTVIITDENRVQSGLIRQTNPPAYLGAIVVCQGGDKPSVRLAIVEAVSNVTGLGADRISVLKMK